MGVKLKRKANSRYKRKVTRTVKTTKEILPKRIREDAIKEKYDKNKTMLQNLNNTDLKEMFAKKLPTHIPDAPLNPPKVSERDAPVCQRLQAKFGNDYAAMARYHKVNIFQWTEAQCKRKVEMWQSGQVSDFGCMEGHAKKTEKKEGKVTLRVRCPR
jgi:hypothetical protein